jgi:hypothetical protein
VACLLASAFGPPDGNPARSWIEIRTVEVGESLQSRLEAAVGCRSNPFGESWASKQNGNLQRKKARSPSKPVVSNEFWHARHTCGHSTYWSSPEVAVRTTTLARSLSAVAGPWSSRLREPSLRPLAYHSNMTPPVFRQLAPAGLQPMSRPTDAMVDAAHKASLNFAWRIRKPGGLQQKRYELMVRGRRQKNSRSKT